VAVRAESVPAWQRGKVASWLVTTDHKRIGILYISTALVFFILAGLMALVMRLQLAQANADIVGPERYNELVSIHGTTMVFLVGVPILAGFANFLVPLMIGTADMAFPRLNALSYWLFAFGGAVIMLSFFADGGANQAGWTCYPPLCTQQPGNGVDFWILGLHVVTASTVAGAVNFLVTIHNMRTRGMTWTRMPLFVWSIELYSWLIIAVMPVLAAALTMLLLDRGVEFGPWDVQTDFFNPADGGTAVLYQQAFLVFGHPEV
jgi:heme/copper-type cytochrome/quinol oxidase subunit 1